MKNKGFTLIELLAVIVILAIIALIAIPMISKIIDKTEDSAVIRSAELYIDGVNQAIMRANLTDKIRPKECIIQEDGNLICDGEYEIKVEATGTKPSSGTLEIEDRTVKSITDMVLDGYEIDTDLKGKIIIKGKIDDYTTPSTGYLMKTPRVNNSDATFLGGNIKRSQVESIEILNKISIPGRAIEKWDVSESKDGSVMAWYVDDDNNGMYELYICGNVKVKANPDSRNLFYRFENVKKIDLTYLDTNDSTNMTAMFSNCSNLVNIIGLNSFNTNNVTDMTSMFSGCKNLISIDLSNFNMNKVTKMSFMFGECEKLTSIDSIIGLNNLDVSKVEDMSWLFENCKGLVEINLEGWTTTNLKQMDRMFYGCTNLKNLNISNLNTSKVTTVQNLFYNCTSLISVDLSALALDSLEVITGIFQECSSLTSVNFGNNLNTSNLKSMGYMFYGCSSLASVDLSKFNTSNVTHMNCMFGRCSSLTSINISNFDTSNVVDMWCMFIDCSNLATIDMRRATFDKVIDMSSMLENCLKLTRIYVKDATARTFINSRLSDAGKTGVTVSIA